MKRRQLLKAIACSPLFLLFPKLLFAKEYALKRYVGLRNMAWQKQKGGISKTSFYQLDFTKEKPKNKKCTKCNKVKNINRFHETKLKTSEWIKAAVKLKEDPAPVMVRDGEYPHGYASVCKKCMVISERSCEQVFIT